MTAFLRFLRFAALLAGSVSALAPTAARAEDTDACIDASERAVAHHRQGHLLDARAELSACAASRCPAVVKSSCEARLAEIRRSIPSVVFAVKDARGQDAANVTLFVDDAGEGQHLGGAIQLDPGDHAFRFVAESGAEARIHLVLREGEQGRRETVTVAPAVPAAPTNRDAAQLARGTADADAAPRPATPRSGGGLGPARTVALIGAGVGLAGLAAGGIFGALSLAAHQSYEQHCGPRVGYAQGVCDSVGFAGHSDAVVKGDLSTWFFVGGGVLTAAGFAVAVLAAPGSPTVGVAPGFVTVRGTF